MPACSNTFNPANGLMRMGWETMCGVTPGDTALDKYFIFQPGETLSNSIEKIQRESIFSNSQRPAGLPSKIPVAGDVPVELDAEGHVYFMANLQGATTTTNIDTGVEHHKLMPSGVTAVPPSFTLEAWRDDDQAQLFNEGKVTQMTFSLAQRTLLTSTISMVFAHSHYWADPAILSGTPAPVPYIRHFPKFSEWSPPSVDGDLFMKVDTITGLPGEFEALFKVSTATAYGTEPTLMIADQWNDCIDSNSTPTNPLPLGTRDMPLQAYVEDPTGLIVGDEWEFDRDRGVWTPVYPDVPPFNEIFATVTFGSTVYCIEQVDLTISRPAGPIWCIGGRFAKKILRRGIGDVTGSIQRQYIDTELRRRLERQEPAVLTIDCYSGEQFETGYEHRIKITCPLIVGEGNTPTISSVDDFPETWNFSAHPDPLNGSYPDDCTIEITNSIASIVV